MSGMHVTRLKTVAAVCAAAVFFLGAGFTAAEDNASTEGVVCLNGVLRVQVKDMRPEDLMKEIGEKCGIKIVVIGEVFSEVPISMRFQDMPVRTGIERVLRRAGIANHILHFGTGDNGTRVVELDLIGKKGGEEYLTQGTVPAAKPREPTPAARQAEKREAKKAAKENLDKAEAQKIQENFLNIMDEVLNAQLRDGEEPDPAEIIKLFKEVVPPEMRDQIPPEVLEELEKLE